jgi:ABC-type transporter lipoprotein component MlaA
MLAFFASLEKKIIHPITVIYSFIIPKEWKEGAAKPLLKAFHS